MSDTTTDDNPRCPHCGSDKGTWFSRTEPMGDICEECGENVDEPPKISATKRWLTEDEQTRYITNWASVAAYGDAALKPFRDIIDRLCSELDKQQEVIGKLGFLLESMHALMRDSHGVAGLHLNGDVATWEELRAGGRFESWLSAYDDAEDAFHDMKAAASARTEAKP